jgi:hypothetical protein
MLYISYAEMGIFIETARHNIAFVRYYTLRPNAKASIFLLVCNDPLAIFMNVSAVSFLFG